MTIVFFFFDKFYVCKYMSVDGILAMVHLITEPPFSDNFNSVTSKPLYRNMGKTDPGCADDPTRLS